MVIWKLWRSLLLSLILILLIPGVALAQANPREPLAFTEADPLWPDRSRELNRRERRQLQIALGQLDQQARELLRQGNTEAAFTVWYRVLRLSQALGRSQEIQALSRIGEIAWQENQTEPVNAISDRLQVIQRTPDLDTETLELLGNAYQKLRSPALALPVYQELLARSRPDPNRTEANLQIIAQLHMAWFDYAAAAPVYQELLELVTRLNDVARQITYTEELAYIYDRTNQPVQAIAARQRLLDYYQNKPELRVKLPAVHIAIGTSNELLRKPQEASNSYQTAYNLAIGNRQYAYAQEALQKLARLYQAYNQPNVAIQVYQTLIRIHQLAYDTYNSMDTYDQMGQIHLQQRNYPAALQMFEQGLVLARNLRYQEAYFQAQVERVRALIPAAR